MKSQNKRVYTNAFKKINVTKEDKNKAKNLLDLTDSLGLSQFISTPTRKYNILNLCSTNINKGILNINILPIMILDHNKIQILINISKLFQTDYLSK